MHMTTTTAFLTGMITGGSLLSIGLLLGGARQSLPQQAPASDVVQAKRIEIVDEVGTVVLAIGSNNDGGSLSVRDRFGKTLVLASASEHGGALAVTSAKLSQPILIARAVESGGSLEVMDGHGKRVLDAGAGE